MAETYTIADLCALPDNALDAMAAELRGWRRSGNYWFNSDNEIVANACNPTTDRNQSYELLMYAVILGSGLFLCC